MSSPMAIAAVAALVAAAELSRRRGRAMDDSGSWTVYQGPLGVLVGRVGWAGAEVDSLVGGLWGDHWRRFYGIGDKLSFDSAWRAAQDTHLPRIVESMGLEMNDRVVVIETLIAEQKGRGFGSQMVRQMEHEARIRDYAAVLLQAGNIEDGAHSRGFWENMGYAAIPGSRYLDDDIRYRKISP